MAKNIWNVEYVFLDEATPREAHVTTVEAPDAEEAKLHTWVRRQLAGDRVSVTSAWR